MSERPTNEGRRRERRRKEYSGEDDVKEETTVDHIAKRGHIITKQLIAKERHRTSYSREHKREERKGAGHSQNYEAKPITACCKAKRSTAYYEAKPVTAEMMAVSGRNYEA